MKNNPSFDLMNLAIQKARETMNQNIGGPFGALVLDSDLQILSIESNRVLQDHDPTAHAEVNAIRQACRKKQTHDLSGCILYTTCYPCPMCLGAIIWSNIKTVIYGCRKEDANQIGFRDDFIYQFIKDDCQDALVLDLQEMHRDQCLELFEEYQKNEKQLY